jgi:23S rRNA U2552 (ribose-2'-O)-methylase RlmE/FtsJ
MDERTKFIRDEKELDELAQIALDDAVFTIQQRLGIKSGDFASHFFSDGEVQQKLFEYAQKEFYNRQFI